jgi:hypothetical protein
MKPRYLLALVTVLVWGAVGVGHGASDFGNGVLPAPEGVEAPPALNQRVREEILDPNRPSEVKVATRGMTTMVFPDKLEAVDADGLAQKPEQEGAFIGSAGPRWVSLKAREENAETNLNVIIAGKAYAIYLKADRYNDFIVRYRFAGGGAAQQAPRRKVTSSRLMSLLDKAKGYPLYAHGGPDAEAMFVGIDVMEYHDGVCVTKDGAMEGQVVRVLRDNSLDALAFEVVWRNRGAAPVDFVPERQAVRVKNEVYPATLAEGPGLIPAQSEVRTFFVVAGGRDSATPNDLSALNDFYPLLRVPDQPQPQP